MSILIVEDNLINSKVLEASLKNEGYATAVTQNGVQALEHLEANPDVDLVIADIMMPKMDGLEFLSRLKAHPVWKEIPVIMCTALGSMADEAAELGSVHYIQKPYSRDELLDKVDHALTVRYGHV